MDISNIGDNNVTLQDLQQDHGHSGIRLSDVLDVLNEDMIQNNPTMVGGVGGGGAGVQTINPTQQPTLIGYNGSSILQQQQPQNQTQRQQQHSNAKNIRRKIYVKIVEQPASKALRFRYECEGRSAGSIPGVNSTLDNKTFPAIEIVGYKGRAVVVVSCVTKDPPYRPHPHNLVGKEGCKKGVCTIEINNDSMRAVFSNLGIQCVKKKDIEQALRAREEIRVDPFKTGFSHRFQASSIDLNSVRLCFQVFLESDVKGRFTVPLQPVVSDPIFDKKAMSDLVICRLCSCSSTVYGGKEIILLCEKVAKEDISVRFFEEQNGHVIWEALGDFQHTDVHKQTAITFRTPRYRSMEIDQPAKVFIQLRRPSDGATSEALPFDYLPLESDPAVLKRKRQKTGGDANAHILRYFQAQPKQQRTNDLPDGSVRSNMNFLNVMTNSTIKTEPRETSPLPYGLYNNSYRLQNQTPSPQPLSPQNAYAQNTSGGSSPYNMGSGGNGNLIHSPHNYGITTAPTTTNETIIDYEVYNQQHQQTGTMNPFRQIQNPPPQHLSQTNNNQAWNLPPPEPMAGNNFVTYIMGSTQQPQSQQPQTTHHPNQNGNGGQAEMSTTSMTNNEAPSLSSLLNMDSEQLMQLNSEELSNLSIS